MTRRAQHEKRQDAAGKLMRALLRVARPYFAPPGPNSDDLFIERVFAYELYHQMRLEFGDGWYVHGEFRKGLRLIPELGSDAVTTPDLVVHQSETVTDNLIAIEIKASPSTKAHEVLADMKKLEFFTRPLHFDEPGLNFEMGVMLLVNCSLPDVYRQGSRATQLELSKLARATPRVVVWNIAVPTPETDSDSGELERGCLRRYYADWAGWCEPDLG